MGIPDFDLRACHSNEVSLLANHIHMSSVLLVRVGITISQDPSPSICVLSPGIVSVYCRPCHMLQEITFQF